MITQRLSTMQKIKILILVILSCSFLVDYLENFNLVNNKISTSG